MTGIRDDLNATIAEMQEELDQLRREVAEWRGKYDRQPRRDPPCQRVDSPSCYEQRWTRLGTTPPRRPR